MGKFIYEGHPHKPQNVNLLHGAELAAAGFNQRLAVTITKLTGNMWCAYLFLLLAILGFPGWHATANQYVQWFSQTTLQLVFLPVLSVGQNVLNRKQELQAEETFNTTMKSFHDIEQIMTHLSKQDDELLEQSRMIKAILEKIADGKS